MPPRVALYMKKVLDAVHARSDHDTVVRMLALVVVQRGPTNMRVSQQGLRLFRSQELRAALFTFSSWKLKETVSLWRNFEISPAPSHTGWPILENNVVAKVLVNSVIVSDCPVLEATWPIPSVTLHRVAVHVWRLFGPFVGVRLQEFRRDGADAIHELATIDPPRLRQVDPRRLEEQLARQVTEGRSRIHEREALLVVVDRLNLDIGCVFVIEVALGTVDRRNSRM